MEDEKKKCRSCKELIWADASVCPKCRTHQKRQLHKKILLGLKDLSSITIIFTLIFAVMELNKFADAWFDNSAYAERLAKSASLLIDSGDFVGARKLLSDAKEIHPASKKVGTIQTQLALISIRESWYPESDKKKEQILKDSLDSLYRALGKENSNDADVLAHIAWATHLLSYYGYDSVDINIYLEKALALNPSSGYANAYKGFWYLQLYKPKGISAPLSKEERVRKAQQHFKVALKQNVSLYHIRRLQVTSLDRITTIGKDNYDDRRFGDLELIKIVLDMHSNDEEYFHKQNGYLRRQIGGYVEWALDNIKGSRSSILEKDRKKYLEYVFLSLNDQEIHTIKEILEAKSNRNVHSVFLSAIINHEKEKYNEAIEGYIATYKIEQYPFYQATLKLLKGVCAKKENLNAKAIALCDDFFKNITP